MMKGADLYSTSVLRTKALNVKWYLLYELLNTFDYDEKWSKKFLFWIWMNHLHYGNESSKQAYYTVSENQSHSQSSLKN